MAINRNLSILAQGAGSANNLSLGGATLGANALAVTGTAAISGNVTIGETTAGTGRINMANAGGGIQQFNSTGGAQEILNLYSDDNLYFSGPSNIIIRPGGGGEAARFDTSGRLQLSNALIYGGVTLSNSVTGTGSMALSGSPTFTGTVTTAELTTTGIKTAVGTATGTAGVWYNTSLTIGSQAPCVWILTASQPSGVSVGSWMITTENGNGNGYVFPMSTGGGMECQMSGTTAQVRGTTYSSTITFRWTKLITA
jgi:hypothetical protein